MKELQDFLQEQKLRGNSPQTMAFYEVVLKKFIRDTGLVDVSELCKDLVVNWRLGLKVRPESVRTYERAVRVWCNWLVRKGKLEVSPFTDVPRLKASNKETYQTFSAQDVERMMAVASEPGRFHRLRDRAILALLLDTGMRAGELASIGLRDILWQDKMIRVVGKTGGRAVPAHKSLRYVQRYLSRERRAMPGVESLVTNRMGFGVLGRDVTQIVRRLARKAGVQATKLGPHTFRHTFALEYLRSGGDVFSLKRILGHADIKTTERYVSWLASDLSDLHHSKSPGSHWL